MCRTQKYFCWIQPIFSLVLLHPLLECVSWGQNTAPQLPTEILEIEQSWRLQSRVGRFDASGIERGSDGEILIVRDSELAVYGVRFQEGSDTANLIKHAQYVVDRKDLNVGVHRFDIEGLAVDSKGILYACDEYARRILRFTSRGLIDSIPIDFSSVSNYFNKTDINASFEGIAIGKDRLYVANERSHGRIIEIDLRTHETIGSFTFRTGGTAWPDTHYSGLDWDKGYLYALLREEQTIAEIDPNTKKPLRLIRYHEVEFAKEHRYQTLLPFFGVMEGLLVEGDTFWLLADNNGQGRYADTSDTRPSLFKCRIKSSN